MKSLYNKSGILPALFMNSRVDCGMLGASIAVNVLLGIGRQV